MESIFQILTFLIDDSLPLPTPPLLFFFLGFQPIFWKTLKKILKHYLFCIIWDWIFIWWYPNPSKFSSENHIWKCNPPKYLWFLGWRNFHIIGNGTPGSGNFIVENWYFDYLDLILINSGNTIWPQIY